MSFGFSVGDFIAVGTLAKQLFDECKAAGTEYKELETLCNNVGISVEACRVNDPFTVMRRQNAAAVTVLIEACTATLNRLRALLGKFNNFSGAKGFVRRIGFVSASDERQSIKQELRDHLNTLQTFMQGSQVDLSSLVVRLLLRQLSEDPSKKLGGLDMGAIPNDDNLIQDFLSEFAPDQNHAKKEVEEKSDDIKSKLKEYEKTKQAPSLETKEKLNENNTIKAITPAPSRNDPYDPWHNQWFATQGFEYLWPVSLVFSTHVDCPIFEPAIRYSEQEEWLCILPEGWSINFTLSNRGSGDEQAFYYVFNNLSCTTNNTPKTSRLYYVFNSFCTKKSGFNMTGPPRFTWNVSPFLTLPYSTPQGIQKFPYLAPQGYEVQNQYTDGQTFPNQPPYRLRMNTPCTGFLTSRSWPIDLSDELSFRLVTIDYGNSGQRVEYRDEDIDKSLPEYWVWIRDITGHGRHIYRNTMTKTDSTVHPARFYREGDSTTITLPPGWDRRLDQFGNLFFVDHHTKSAVREDPRFNPNIDQKTGLPKGWHQVLDKKGRPFFYREVGQQIIGTNQPWTMRTKSMDKKEFIRRIPKEGENMMRLLERYDSEDEKEEEEQHPVERVQTPEPKILEVVPEISDEREKAYLGHFSAIINQYSPKANKIGAESAYLYCQALGIPRNIVPIALQWADTNDDKFFNPKEFPKALHMMYCMLEKHYEESGIPPYTPQQEIGYEEIFAKAKPVGNYLATLDEVLSASKDWDLPDDLVRQIWFDCNDSGGGENARWTVDEFVIGYHRGTVESERQKILQAIGNPPAPQKADSTMITNEIVAEEQPASNQDTANDGSLQTGFEHQGNQAQIPEHGTEASMNTQLGERSQRSDSGAPVVEDTIKTEDDSAHSVENSAIEGWDEINPNTKVANDQKE